METTASKSINKRRALGSYQSIFGALLASDVTSRTRISRFIGGALWKAMEVRTSNARD